VPEGEIGILCEERDGWDRRGGGVVVRRDAALWSAIVRRLSEGVWKGKGGLGNETDTTISL